MRNVPSVATIGWTRRNAARKPFKAPDRRPAADREGNDDERARPAWDMISHCTIMTLIRPIKGPTDTSIAPRPARKGGVTARAASRSGDIRPSSVPQFDGAKRPGSR
jgi:hypothetical protein